MFDLLRSMQMLNMGVNEFSNKERKFLFNETLHTFDFTIMSREEIRKKNYWPRGLVAQKNVLVPPPPKKNKITIFYTHLIIGALYEL